RSPTPARSRRERADRGGASGAAARPSAGSRPAARRRGRAPPARGEQPLLLRPPASAATRRLASSAPPPSVRARRRPRIAAGTPASSARPRRPAGTAAARPTSGGSRARARRRRSGTTAACRGVRPLGTGAPRARRAAGRTSSASRCAPGPPARSGTRARDRPARAAAPPSRAAQARTLLHMGPFRVTVSRGSVVEAVHRVHAVAVQDGRIVDAAGDPQLVTFYRSSSKPIQALPLARERPDVTDVELAIACASHRAADPQVAAASSLLAKAPSAEADLECGPQEGRGPSRLAHNCSGKHAGFLAVCRARGWPTRGYHLAEHPLQQLLL